VNILTIYEQIILTSILALKDEAYGVAIRKKAREYSGKAIMYGSLYNVLDQLYRKGYVTRTTVRPARGEGGYGKIFYAVTPSGIKALKEAQAIQKALWSRLPAFAKNR
jgi:PadR family transcriptional regulator PadR